MSFDIEKTKRKVLLKLPYFDTIISKVKYVEDETCYSNGCPTAGTDGYTIYYHPEFMNGLTEEEQAFILAHEIYHIADNHIKRSEGKEKDTWNIATDAVINASLQKMGFPLVEGVVNMPDAIDYDAETYYEKLRKENQDRNKNDNQNRNGNQGNGDVGHDTHKKWGEFSKEQSEGKETSKKPRSMLDKLLKRPKKEDLHQEEEKRKEELEQEIERISRLDPKQIYEENKKMRKKNLEERRKKRTEQALGVGNITESELFRLDDIGIAKRLVDWKRLLKQNAKYPMDWTFQNATIEYGIITPHLEKLEYSETEILLDTSGSINDELLRNFLRECKNILKDSNLKVGCFDTKFYGFHDIKTEKDIEEMEFIGRGGTDFDVAVGSFSKTAANKIIFTDGWASMPKEEADIIWIVFGGRTISPKGGRVISVDQESFKTSSRHR